MEELENLLEEFTEKIYNDEEFVLEDYGRLYNVLESKLTEDDANKIIKDNKDLFKKYGINPTGKMSASDLNSPGFKNYYNNLKKMDLEKLKKERRRLIDLGVSAMKKYDERKDEKIIITALKMFATSFGIGIISLIIPQYTKIFNGGVAPSVLYNSFRACMNSIRVLNTVIDEKEKEQKKSVKESYYYGYESVFDKIYNL